MTSQPLFYNPNILIGNKSLFLRSWFDNRIQIINDLIDCNANLLTIDEFKKRYKFDINFINFQGICLALRKYMTKMSYSNTNYTNVNIPSFFT